MFSFYLANDVACKVSLLYFNELKVDKLMRFSLLAPVKSFSILLEIIIQRFSMTLQDLNDKRKRKCM